MTDKGRIAKISATIAAVNTGVRLYNDYKQRWDDRRKYSISVEEDSYLHIPILKWLSEHEEKTRHFKLEAGNKELTLIQNMQKALKFDVDGYTITLETPSEDRKPGIQANIYGELETRRATMTFTATSEAGLKALENLFEELRVQKSRVNHEVSGFVSSSFGWNRKPLPKRHLDKIFLPHGVKERVLSDIERFLGDEEKYETIGAPWHRGYLLYGPPGNGKTSLVQGLAHYYGMDVYSMPLSSVANDAQLNERMGQIEPRSFLLVEDIDIFKDAVSRDAEKKVSGPTLAGLLNAFDGMNTPHGLITFFTTNVKETLDPALVRDGRMDMHVELLPPERYQIESMFEATFGEELFVNPRDFSSMAQYVNILKKNLDNPEAARLEIKGA